MLNAKPRPPYVSFDTKAVEDRAATIEKGRPCYTDVHFAYITPMGSKDRIEMEVQGWFATLEKEVEAERFDPAWLDNYRRKYDAWSKGQEVPVDGTHISHWPGLSPSMFKNLTHLNILTIEDVADMNEEALAKVGMGGRELKRKAQTFLEASAGAGGLSERMEALSIENGQLKASLEQLQRKIDEQIASAVAKDALKK